MSDGWGRRIGDAGGSTRSVGEGMYTCVYMFKYTDIGSDVKYFWPLQEDSDREWGTGHEESRWPRYASDSVPVKLTTILPRTLCRAWDRRRIDCRTAGQDCILRETGYKPVLRPLLIHQLLAERPCENY